MDVVAQWVRTSWTKSSRGGEAAARRNAVPIAFPLPETTSPLAHAVTMREADGFTPRSSALRALPDRGEAQLREKDRRLRVMLVNTQWAGVIRRRPPAIRLHPGEWVRWQITYRQASYLGRGPWHYSLVTLNLAFGPVAAEDIFLGTPTKYVDERAQLTRYRRERTWN